MSDETKRLETAPDDVSLAETEVAAEATTKAAAHEKPAKAPGLKVTKKPKLVTPSSPPAGSKKPAEISKKAVEQKAEADAETGGKASAASAVETDATPEKMAAPAPERADAEKDARPAGGKKLAPPPPKPPKTDEQLAWEAAKKAHFDAAWWQPILKPVIVLVSICLITSLLLGITNAVTEPIIQENSRLASEQERIRLLPQATGFTEIPVDGSGSVTAIYKADNDAGFVIAAYGRGYGGQVPALVAFDANGTIVGVAFMENSETVGLGQKVRDATFADQFAGKPNRLLSLSDIDVITSATISSGAAVNAVNAAIEAYNAQTGGAVAMAPEEVRAWLLPGETLTEITVQAPNVQATAWRGSKGNYIIYGEKPSEREGSNSVVVAAVAMDPNGVILNLWIDTSGESPAYGALLPNNTAFMQSFIGKTAPVEVDVVAGVSNSSRSVMQAVNSALAALSAAKEVG